MREQYQAPQVLVGGEYVELPQDARYDITKGEIIEPPVFTRRSLGFQSLKHVTFWGPARRRTNADAPEGLSYSA